MACHNADKGGANQLGPNLWDVIGEPIGQGKGFAFSDALAKKGGTWNWDNLSQWLTSPKAFAPGTKMTFAGLSNPQDRANVIAFLNHAQRCAQAASRGARPRGRRGKPGERARQRPQKAEKEPVAGDAQPATRTSGEARRRPRAKEALSSRRHSGGPRSGPAAAPDALVEVHDEVPRFLGVLAPVDEVEVVGRDHALPRPAPRN